MIFRHHCFHHANLAFQFVVALKQLPQDVEEKGENMRMLALLSVRVWRINVMEGVVADVSKRMNSYKALK